MKKQTFGTLKSSAATLALGLALISTTAYAQEAASADEAAADEGSKLIIVTGSRIARPEEDSPNPVISFNARTLQQSGLTNITDLLVQSPALLASQTNQDAGGSNALFGGVGINLLDLRNLGADRTLVLVNGRRHVSGLSGSAAVDINTIPNALIEDIQVLTGGVSAVYGADGVSGVVNFILKRDFEGIDARFQTGISSRGDTGNLYGAITAGTNFADDRGNVALSYEYNRNDRVTGDRRRSGRALTAYSFARNLADLPDNPNIPDRILYNDLRYADSAPGGAVDTDIDFTPNFTGAGKPYDLGISLPSSGGVVQGGDSTPVAGYDGDLQPKTEKHSINLLTSFEFSPGLRLFAEGKYVKTRNFSVSQPSFDFFTILLADNPYLPAAIQNAIVPDALGAAFGAPPGAVPDGVLVSRDNFDLGVRGQYAERETLRGVIGFDGELSDHARYELSYVYGQSTTNILQTNYRLRDRYFAAIDAVQSGGQIVCRSNLGGVGDPIGDINFGGNATTFTTGPNSGCLPLNLMGEGVASQAAIDWINTDLASRMRLKQQVLSGSVNGDFSGIFELPAGPVRWALGAEYRKESSDFRADPLLQAGALADLAPQQNEHGSFNVKEAFAELDVPLLRDKPFFHLLRAGAAIRFSDYSTVGKTTTWKVDGNWAPIPDINFRATYSQAVRAPNITELFSPQNGTFLFIDDPCDPINIPEGTEFRQANCTALLTDLGINPATFNPTNSPVATASLPGRIGGNPLLDEETAKSWTAGVVLKPRFMPNLSVTFDWYDITLKNAISVATAQELVELCVDQPTVQNQFCANVGRDPATGFVNDYLIGPANVSRFKTSGGDFTVNYSLEPKGGWGVFNMRLSGGYLENVSYIPTPGATVDVDTLEKFSPRWNGTFDLTWVKDNVTINYGLNYFSKTRRFTTQQMAANPDLVEPKYVFFRAKVEHDIQVSARIADDRFTIYGGVNNIFDRLPDVGQSGYPSSFRGRYFYVGARINID